MPSGDRYQGGQLGVSNLAGRLYLLRAPDDTRAAGTLAASGFAPVPYHAYVPSFGEWCYAYLGSWCPNSG